MRFPTLLTIAGILGIVFGIGFLVLPAFEPHALRRSHRCLAGSSWPSSSAPHCCSSALVFLFIRDIPRDSHPATRPGAPASVSRGLCSRPHPARRTRECVRVSTVAITRAGDCVWFVRCRQDEEKSRMRLPRSRRAHRFQHEDTKGTEGSS
mgnify:CR=1 FL=1